MISNILSVSHNVLVQVLSTAIWRGNEVEEIDANGYSRMFIKGSDGELLSYVDSDGFEYRTEYNSNGLISAFVIPDGRRTQINYDSEGHISNIVNPDSLEATFGYDSNDRVVSLIVCITAWLMYLGVAGQVHAQN